MRIAEGLPGALPPVPEDGTEMTVFENAIRRIGVFNACEWFGFDKEDSFTQAAIFELMQRNKEAEEL